MHSCVRLDLFTMDPIVIRTPFDIINLHHVNVDVAWSCCSQTWPKHPKVSHIISNKLKHVQTSSNMFPKLPSLSSDVSWCFSICVTVFWCVWLACHCLRCTLEHWDIERPAKNLLKSYCVYMYTIVYVYSYIMLYIYNLYILCIYIYMVRTCQNTHL